MYMSSLHGFHEVPVVDDGLTSDLLKKRGDGEPGHTDILAIHSRSIWEERNTGRAWGLIKTWSRVWYQHTTENGAAMPRPATWITLGLGSGPVTSHGHRPTSMSILRFPAGPYVALTGLGNWGGLTILFMS